VVVEVSVNAAWCCDPVPPVCQAAALPGSEEECAQQDCFRCNRHYRGRYHKADYSQMARLMGRRHVMVDPESRTPPATSNPISSERVYVGGARLAAVVKEAYQAATTRLRPEDLPLNSPARVAGK
jgi:hypothetical protein